MLKIAHAARKAWERVLFFLRCISHEIRIRRDRFLMLLAMFISVWLLCDKAYFGLKFHLSLISNPFHLSFEVGQGFWKKNTTATDCRGNRGQKFSVWRLFFQNQRQAKPRFFCGFRADLDHLKIRGSPLLYQGQMKKKRTFLLESAAGVRRLKGKCGERTEWTHQLHGMKQPWLAPMGGVVRWLVQAGCEME